MAYRKPKVAIVNYEMGNLFSVQRACAHVGMDGEITNAREDLLSADAVILPGVGAFADAMSMLDRLGLIGTLKDVAAMQKPLFGICLGMQLLLDKSQEFGEHSGLGLIKGSAVRFDGQIANSMGETLKVPQVGWNHICKAKGPTGVDAWNGTFLADLADKEFMYFVHSYYAKLDNPELSLSQSQYGPIEFCSSFQHGNIMACQFHPERSGEQGLSVYRNIAEIINKN